MTAHESTPARMPQHPPIARRAVVALVVGGLAASLAACSKGDDNSIAQSANDGSRKNYISGSGTVQTIPPEKRTDGPALSGPTIDGGTWSLKGKDGTVVVVNVWGSWCPPCVKETPELVKAHATLKAKGVEFVGLDVKESPESGQAFATANKVTWPSLAYDGGKPLLQLKGLAPSFPTTLILDGKGRVAARVNGEVDATTLVGLAEDVLTEKG